MIRNHFEMLEFILSVLVQCWSNRIQSHCCWQSNGWRERTIFCQKELFFRGYTICDPEGGMEHYIDPPISIFSLTPPPQFFFGDPLPHIFFEPPPALFWDPHIFLPFCPPQDFKWNSPYQIINPGGRGPPPPGFICLTKSGLLRPPTPP